MRPKRYQMGHCLDHNDPRDFIVTLPQFTLPAKVDLRGSLPNPIRDQGKLGSCTGFVGAGHREYLLSACKKQLAPVLSPLYLYYQTRSLGEATRTDSGATLRDMLKSLQKTGICPEEYMPYNPEDFNEKPSEQALSVAQCYQIESYARLQSLAMMQRVLAQKETFVLGIPAYESLESDNVRRSGVVPLPRQGEAQIGGHAVHVVGYMAVEGKMHFIFANSWGVTWGKKGFGFLPFAYLEQMPYDAWMASAKEEANI